MAMRLSQCVRQGELERGKGNADFAVMQSFANASAYAILA